jgi:hypothetical protein
MSGSSGVNSYFTEMMGVFIQWKVFGNTPFTFTRESGFERGSETTSSRPELAGHARIRQG